MKPPGPEAPQVLVKWYANAKWVLELLVKATYAWEKEHKAELLRQANEGIEMTRWTVRMCSDRRRLSSKQFEFSAGCLNECGRMVGGWWKQARG